MSTQEIDILTRPEGDEIVDWTLEEAQRQNEAIDREKYLDGRDWERRHPGYRQRLRAARAEANR